ncbi:sporulation membrane protein YtrI [Evansella sp. AB-rgal1]|uniref:sporulation membrane protein YtrI n=1 Tax=Evansella sp. AB-rgal1 TaxID=3242696 RepID=UPI00359E47C4
MRIPPHYRDKSWQRLFAGFILGMIFGWMFFLYHYGLVHDKLIMQMNELNTTITKQENKIESLQQARDEQSEELQKNLTVQDIEIGFTNEDEINLSELALHNLRNALENELDIIRNRNIQTVAESIDLLYSAVENKVYGLNDKRYRFKIEMLYLYTTTEVKVKIETE